MVQIILVHSMLRWLIVLIAISTIIKLALGCLRLAEPSRFDRPLSASFAGVMDVQFVLGATIIAGRAIGYGLADISYILPHAVNMVFAVVAAHAAARWSKKPGKPLRTLIATVMSLLFVFVGVNELPQGWSG